MSESSVAPAVVNLLLASLPTEEAERVFGCCERVDLAFGDILCEPDQPLLHVYFPLTGFVSRVTALAGHPALEMGLVGNEGMLGATLSLGVNGAPMRTVVQGAGLAAAPWGGAAVVAAGIVLTRLSGMLDRHVTAISAT